MRKTEVNFTLEGVDEVTASSYIYANKCSVQLTYIIANTQLCVLILKTKAPVFRRKMLHI